MICEPPVRSAQGRFGGLGSEGAEVELAGVIEADRAGRVGEEGFEGVEVSDGLGVKGGETLGETGGHAGEGQRGSPPSPLRHHRGRDRNPPRRGRPVRFDRRRGPRLGPRTKVQQRLGFAYLVSFLSS